MTVEELVKRLVALMQDKPETAQWEVCGNDLLEFDLVELVRERDRVMLL